MNNNLEESKRSIYSKIVNKLRLHVGTRFYLTAYLNSASWLLRC